MNKESYKIIELKYKLKELEKENKKQKEIIDFYFQQVLKFASTKEVKESNLCRLSDSK